MVAHRIAAERVNASFIAPSSHSSLDYYSTIQESSPPLPQQTDARIHSQPEASSHSKPTKGNGHADSLKCETISNCPKLFTGNDTAEATSEVNCERSMAPSSQVCADISRDSSRSSPSVVALNNAVQAFLSLKHEIPEDNNEAVAALQRIAFAWGKVTFEAHADSERANDGLREDRGPHKELAHKALLSVEDMDQLASSVCILLATLRRRRLNLDGSQLTGCIVACAALIKSNDRLYTLQIQESGGGPMHGALKDLVWERSKEGSKASSSAATSEKESLSNKVSDKMSSPEARMQQSYQNWLINASTAAATPQILQRSQEQPQRPFKPRSDFNLWIKPKDAMFDFSQTLLLERGERVRSMDPTGRLQALKAIAACHREKSEKVKILSGPFLMPLLNLSLSLATSETVQHAAAKHSSVSSRNVLTSALKPALSVETTTPLLQKSGQDCLDSMSRGLQSQIESQSWFDGLLDHKRLELQAQHPSFSVESRQAHAAQLVHFVARSGMEVSEDLKYHLTKALMVATSIPQKLEAPYGALALWSYAKLGLGNDYLLNNLFAAVQTSLTAASQQEAAIISWSCATLVTTNASSPTSISSSPDSNTLPFMSPHLMTLNPRDVVQQAAERMRVCLEAEPPNPQAVCNMCWAVSKLKLGLLPLLKPLLFESSHISSQTPVQKLLEGARGQHLAMLAWSMGEQRYIDAPHTQHDRSGAEEALCLAAKSEELKGTFNEKEAFTQILRSIASHIAKGGIREGSVLISVVWALCQQGVPHRTFFAAAAEAATSALNLNPSQSLSEKLPSRVPASVFSPAHMSKLLWASAVLGHHTDCSKVRTFFKAYETSVDSVKPYSVGSGSKEVLHAKEAVRIAMAFHEAGLKLSPEMLKFISRVIRRKCEELTLPLSIAMMRVLHSADKTNEVAEVMKLLDDAARRELLRIMKGGQVRSGGAHHALPVHLTGLADWASALDVHDLKSKSAAAIASATAQVLLASDGQPAVQERSSYRSSLQYQMPHAGGGVRQKLLSANEASLNQRACLQLLTSLSGLGVWSRLDPEDAELSPSYLQRESRDLSFSGTEVQDLPFSLIRAMRPCLGQAQSLVPEAAAKLARVLGSFALLSHQHPDHKQSFLEALLTSFDGQPGLLLDMTNRQLVDVAWGLVACGYRRSADTAADEEGGGGCSAMDLISARYMMSVMDTEVDTSEGSEISLLIDKVWREQRSKDRSDLLPEPSGSHRSKNRPASETACLMPPASLRALTPGYLARMAWALGSANEGSGRMQALAASEVRGQRRKKSKNSSNVEKTSASTKQPSGSDSLADSSLTRADSWRLQQMLLERLGRLCFQRLSAFKLGNLALVIEGFTLVGLEYDGLFMAVAQRAKQFHQKGQSMESVKRIRSACERMGYDVSEIMGRAGLLDSAETTIKRDYSRFSSNPVSRMQVGDKLNEDVKRTHVSYSQSRLSERSRKLARTVKVGPAAGHKTSYGRGRFRELDEDDEDDDDQAEWESEDGSRLRYDATASSPLRRSWKSDHRHPEIVSTYRPPHYIKKQSPTRNNRAFG
ncbi:hypothetical protein CEUSTIGMA_g2327.t1 [Chlamydomonas eustigma]|uniref:Uncharacterized protein n=1 Tax=Chlamydomonas eustigma TaxID=1157962 RepID=A0A250WVN3_9CHLO|nr:hypothetical protein CEUSTIGMA_g2327.t1 [Chlamydomonas eustigma]|eukprot:GAX74881.1 hypothetical protein CEUSTIGMA_g2327.t1 [Chlamydomonas eustigma]